MPPKPSEKYSIDPKVSQNEPWSSDSDMDLEYTIQRKDTQKEEECEVWTLPELLNLSKEQLEAELVKWKSTGFQPTEPSTGYFDSLLEYHFFNYWTTVHMTNSVLPFYELYPQIWTEYWLIVSLFGKPKKIPQKLIDNKTNSTRGQGLFWEGDPGTEDAEDDAQLLGTRNNFIKFAINKSHQNQRIANADLPG